MRAKYLVESQTGHTFIHVERGTIIAYRFYQNTLTQAFSVCNCVVFGESQCGQALSCYQCTDSKDVVSPTSRLACVRPPVTDPSLGGANHNGCKTSESCVV